MNFNFTDEQQLLADTVQRFVREHYSFEARHEILKSKEGWSREVWQELANLGITALNVPEQHGGLGAGPVETMLVMNALGAGLVLEPFLGSAVLAPALLTSLADDRVSAELLPIIATGERIVIVAHEEAHARGDLSNIATRAEQGKDGWILDGSKSVVVHGDIADDFLITARSRNDTAAHQGVSVFRVPATTEGLRIDRYRTFDGLSAADLHLQRVRVPASNLVGAEGEGFAAIEVAHDIALSALCAEAVGIMKAVNATTLEYSKNRKQFGQPIGRFQVLQHRMADMFIHGEQATSMSYLAAIRCVDAGLAERRRALAASKVIIGQAGRFIAQQAVQIHGGMGMTDEMMVSHHFKRLTAIDLTLGDVDFHMQRFVAVANG
jgi:hypothetical protein